MLCLVAASLAPAAAALHVPEALTRRTALKNVGAAMAAAALPLQANAEVCLGKCPEDPTKKAERLAIQTGAQEANAQVYSSGVEGLIQMSIRNAEAANGGTPLTDYEKAQIATKVRGKVESQEVRTESNAAYDLIFWHYLTVFPVCLLLLCREAPARPRSRQGSALQKIERCARVQWLRQRKLASLSHIRGRQAIGARTTLSMPEKW